MSFSSEILQSVYGPHKVSVDTFSAHFFTFDFFAAPFGHRSNKIGPFMSSTDSVEEHWAFELKMAEPIINQNKSKA